MSDLTLLDEAVDANEALISFIKLLGYGPPGTGKTSLMSTMPEPLLYLLTERHGDMSVKRVNPKARIIYIDDKKDERGLCVRTAKEQLLGIIEELSWGKHQYASVVLDSLTDAQRILLLDMKGGRVGAKLSLPEWGVLIEQTRDLVVRLRNLPMHVGVITLSGESEDDQKRIIYRPELAGKKLPAGILQYFNLVAFQTKRREQARTGKSEYISIVDGGETIYTKMHPALNAEEVPNVRQWIEKIEAYAKEHGEGDFPTATVVKTQAQAPRGNPKPDIARLLEDAEIKELFDKLKAPDAKRRVTIEKHGSRDAIVAALKRAVAEIEKTAEKPAEKPPGGEPPPSSGQGQPPQT